MTESILIARICRTSKIPECVRGSFVRPDRRAVVWNFYPPSAMTEAAIPVEARFLMTEKAEPGIYRITDDQLPRVAEFANNVRPVRRGVST